MNGAELVFRDESLGRGDGSWGQSAGCTRLAVQFWISWTHIKRQMWSCASVIPALPWRDGRQKQDNNLDVQGTAGLAYTAQWQKQREQAWETKWKKSTGFQKVVL